MTWCGGDSRYHPGRWVHKPDWVHRVRPGRVVDRGFPSLATVIEETVVWAMGDVVAAVVGRPVG
ncbi:hypothetical protein BKA80DRAFT_273894 [Phyllosticta citrichinensis]